MKRLIQLTTLILIAGVTQVTRSEVKVKPHVRSRPEVDFMQNEGHRTNARVKLNARSREEVKLEQDVGPRSKVKTKYGAGSRSEVETVPLSGSRTRLERNAYAETKHLGAKTFISLVNAANLTTTLLDPKRNLTVFAPTDPAFARLPPEVMKALQQNATLRRKLVTFHLGLGSHPVRVSTLVNTMSGHPAHVVVYVIGSSKTQTIGIEGQERGGRNNTTPSFFPVLPVVSGARVLLGDSPASNGLVQILDDVMWPLPRGNALQLLSGTNFSTLFLALAKAGASGIFQAEERTIFAPTDQAFQRLAPGELTKLLSDLPLLTKVLQNHVTKGIVYGAYLIKEKGHTLLMESGETLNVTVTEKTNVIKIAGAIVTSRDVNVDNGVVHVIDSVLLPKAFKHH